jgi:hypothetical protein
MVLPPVSESDSKILALTNGLVRQAFAFVPFIHVLIRPTVAFVAKRQRITDRQVIVRSRDF